MNRSPENLTQRLLGGLDLAIDLLTLGQYGLEVGEPERERGCPRDGLRGERCGRETGWEALARPTAGAI